MTHTLHRKISAAHCGAWLLLALLSGACSALAQQTGKRVPAVAKAPLPHVEETEAQEAPEPPNKPGTESVKVHGHWIIDVRDRNGRIVEHRDFQNSLVSQGNDLLTSLLIGGYAAAYPAIGFSSAGLSYLFVFPSPVDCSYSHLTPPDCGTNLQMYAGGSGLTLVGDTTTSADISIDSVNTFVYSCPLSAPATCSQLGNRTATGLTLATLGTPIKLTAGQSLHVQVALTFN